MKALRIILGIWIIITGICAMARVCEMDQVTGGIYAFCLGLMTLTEGLSAGRKK